MKRLFVGIPISAEMTEGINIFKQEAVRDDLVEKTGVNFTETANLHITVAFLGSIPEKFLKNITEIVCRVAHNTVQFELLTDDICAVPREKKVRMIWVVFKINSLFDQLVRTIRHEIKIYLRQAGRDIKLPVERSIIPHITLARFKKTVLKKDVNLPFFALPGKYEVKQLSLYASETKSTGPVYTNLATFYLKKSA